MIKSNIKTKVIATATMIAIVNFTAIADTFASSDADYTFTLASDWHNCQQISAEYQEVYAFETESFYINICQKEDVYFYSGEAKQSHRSSIFIPANPLENNRGFQAENGNVSYLVLLPFSQPNENNKVSDLKPAEAILRIERNGELVSIESSLNKYCHQSADAIAFNIIESPLQDNNHIATIPQSPDFGSNVSFINQSKLLPPEIFKSGSRFDFYQVGGQLHRLTTCNK